MPTALTKLAEMGDDEAKQFLDKAAKNQGRLEITPDQAEKIIARAREKGLRGKC